MDLLFPYYFQLAFYGRVKSIYYFSTRWIVWKEGTQYAIIYVVGFQINSLSATGMYRQFYYISFLILWLVMVNWPVQYFMVGSLANSVDDLRLNFKLQYLSFYWLHSIGIFYFNIVGEHRLRLSPLLYVLEQSLRW